MKDTILFVLGSILALLIPFAVIGALNTLFTLGIAYTLWTWLSVTVLMIVFALLVNLGNGNK